MDLSKEFHPVPKPSKIVKMPKKINQIGKKTKEWNDVRDELKQKFYKGGIVECELRLPGCWKNNALSFAHIDKRRKLTKEDLYKVVLACTPCHTEVEVKKDMREILERIIKNRKWKK